MSEAANPLCKHAPPACGNGSSDPGNGDPANTGNTPDNGATGSCLYLNAAGTGISPGEGATGGGIDPNSTQNECQTGGGVFTTGTITGFLTDPNSDSVLIVHTTAMGGTVWDFGQPGLSQQPQSWPSGARPASSIKGGVYADSSGCTLMKGIAYGAGIGGLATGSPILGFISLMADFTYDATCP